MSWEATNSLAQLSLVDINGRVLLRKTLSPASLSTQVDMSDLPGGIYLLQLTSATGNVSSKRIIKQ